VKLTFLYNGNVGYHSHESVNAAEKTGFRIKSEMTVTVK